MKILFFLIMSTRENICLIARAPLQGKTRSFSGFLKKKHNFKSYAFGMRKCLSKCIKLCFFQKKNLEEICVPTLSKFSDLLPETHLFFIWPNVFWTFFCVCEGGGAGLLGVILVRVCKPVFYPGFPRSGKSQRKCSRSGKSQGISTWVREIWIFWKSQEIS